jgi:group II intron reverse transcriptase/maturase
MLETERNQGVPSMASLESAEKGGAENMLERILNRDNLNAAYKRVRANGGAPGVDGMTVDDLLPYLKEHKDELLERIRLGRYRPQPVRRVEIPKSDGGKRLLGVPTVIDRMLQQAVAQVLQPIFEKTFSDSSYGFRPGRNAHQAVKKAKQFYEEGYTRVVDIDLEKYFDTVNHDLLIGMVREKVKDEKVIGLIRSFLKSGVMVEGVCLPTDEGTPQGGNLSPLLSNIYLTGFDRMLEARGHRFVRYADDCNIYVRSQRAAERVMESCIGYLEGRLKLRVNRQKSRTGSPLKLKFLGFSLYKRKTKVGIRPHGKSMDRFKARVKELTSRKQAKSIADILKNLRRYTVGWLGYYAIADMGAKMKALNEWLRRRIRQIHWKQWKKIRTRKENLIRLGIPHAKAWEWANSRKGYWRVAHSWILSTSLNNKCLESLGYVDISRKYEALHSNY